MKPKYFILLKIGIMLLILAGAIIKMRAAEAANILYRLTDINPGSADAVPESLININGTLFFAAYNDVQGWSLWKSDGTRAGTILVRESCPNPPPDIICGSEFEATINNLIDVNGTLFFTAPDDGGYGSKLWKSDGTPAGTVMVKDINPVNGAAFWTYFYSGSMANVNGILFFVADDGVHGTELWKSDGTAAGTVLVKDINPGSGGAFSSNFHSGSLTNVNGTLFFSASDGVHNFELWKSDGTPAGTVMVKDIYPGPFRSAPIYLTNFNGTLFFRADDGIHGAALWKSNGTTTGTMLVKDVSPGCISIDCHGPTKLTTVNGTLFFVGGDSAVSPGLWKSDGTTAGTVLLKTFHPVCFMGFCFTPTELTNVNGTLFFVADDGGVNGGELWKSDGTAAGTLLVKNITSPYQLINVNGTLFFGVGELWQSDGTADGTVQLSHIYPGGDAFPYYLTNVNGLVFFRATDGVTGHELWLFDARGGLNLTNTVNPLNPSPGSQAVFRFTLTNHSPTLAVTTAHISDTLPTGLTLAGPVSLNPPQPGAILATSPLSFPTVASNITITAKSQLVLTFPITVSGSLPTGTIVINKATITGAEVPDPAVGVASVYVAGQLTFLPLILK